MQKIRRGLTWRTMLAFVFATFIIQPAITYYYLISNTVLPLAGWLIIILWTELAAAFGSPLSKQEVFILLAFQWVLTGATYALYFVWPVKYMYYSTSPIVEAFGITPYIPSWWVPPRSVVNDLMTVRFVFLHPSWVTPLSITVISILLGLIANISMGYFCYGLYVQVEKLDFPAATAQAETALTLAERKSEPLRVLSISAVLGVVYNLISNFLPWFLGPYMSSGGVAIAASTAGLGTGGGLLTAQAAPLLRWDFTQLIAPILPGAGLSFTLSLIYYLPGILLPIPVSLAQVIGSYAFYFVGTHIITRLGFWPAESEYNVSWTIDTLVQRAQLYFYVSVIIGLGLAAVFVPVLIKPKNLLRAFSSISRASSASAEGAPPLKLLLLLFFASCSGSVLLIHFLVPNFPIWILILFIMGGSFFFSFLGTSAAGVTYSGITVPYLQQLPIYYSGYQGRDIWFAPVNIYTDGAYIAQAFKQADICEATHAEYVKTFLIVVALGLVSSFISMNIFWSISPIPSSAYPATITLWPVDAMNWARLQYWIWSGYLFRDQLIIGSFAAGALIYAISTYLFKMPFFLISFITGGMMSPELAMAMFLGSLLGHKLAIRFLGEERFFRWRGNIVIGFTIGWGFLELLRGTLMLIGRSMWIIPY